MGAHGGTDGQCSHFATPYTSLGWDCLKPWRFLSGGCSGTRAIAACRKSEDGRNHTINLAWLGAPTCGTPSVLMLPFDDAVVQSGG